MHYKGYTARIEYSDEDDCFVGHIAGIDDIIGFHSDSVAKLHAAFEEAVEDYLITCDKVGKLPQKPYSGHITLHLPSEIHAKVAILAQIQGKSINSLVTELLSKIN